MTIVIALIGRPNVGKSTLFNRLTRTNNSLVMDFPGLTRDRKYGYVTWKDHEFNIIDTSGIYNTKDEIGVCMIQQSLIAIKEADIIFFIVDGRTGIVKADQDIVKYLRVSNKNIFIVINKIDEVKCNNFINDFYNFGINNIVTISALHGYGINTLLDQVLLLKVDNNSLLNNHDKYNLWQNNTAKLISKKRYTSEFNKSLPIKIVVVGRPNVGKSMLINRIIGKERMIVYDMPGTTRDSIYIPILRNKQEYILIDTAGIRQRNKITEKIEKFSIIKTLQAIKDANVVILIIDAKEGILNQDLSILNIVINSGRALVIAINKWDKVSGETCISIRQEINRRLKFINFTRVHFISALLDIGISNLFKSINEAYQCSNKQISTSLLTRIMQIAVGKHQPPLVCGRRVKIKYAHIGGYNPILIVVHGTHIKNLPNNYKRYLINYFQRSLEIVGTPIKIQLNNNNPFMPLI